MPLLKIAYTFGQVFEDKTNVYPISSVQIINIKLIQCTEQNILVVIFYFYSLKMEFSYFFDNFLHGFNSTDGNLPIADYF